jgi:ligand-binding SRPBCC domain-containing protein
MKNLCKHYILLGIFTLQMLLSPMLNAAIRIDLQESANDPDLLLICTGSEYRWISLSQSAASGDFVFVDTPESTPEIQDLPNCLWAWQNSHIALEQITPDFEITFVVEHHLEIKASSSIAQTPYYQYYSRAPPILNIS